MNNALFDPITNSEDAMITRVGIKKYHACTYLRAYIMASLCFEPQLVVSDSTVNLNRAFRTLIDHREGDGFYKLDYLPKADFEQLILNGHIRFAARDTFGGDFSEALRTSQMGKQALDLPSENYTRKIDDICSNEYVYWYNLKEISKMFTSKFRDGIGNELNNNTTITPEQANLLQNLINRLSDRETITYNEVKSILLENYSEKDAEYQYVRKILRQSYDYNVPELLGLDYCMPLQGITPSRHQDWMLKVNNELSLECNLLCNVYGFSELPVSHLKYIWESSEYENFQRQINRFRAKAIELDEYVISLKNYLLRINEVVRDVYTIKHNQNLPYEKRKLSSIPVGIRYYINADNAWVVIAKVFNDLWGLSGVLENPVSFMLSKAISKVIPILAQKGDIFPDPPEEINEAIILQNKAGKDSYSNTETKQKPLA